MDPLPDSLYEVSNDEHMSMYIAALGRSVLVLHDLLNNKASVTAAENAPTDEKKDAATDEKGAAAEKAAEKGTGASK